MNLIIDWILSLEKTDNKDGDRNTMSTQISKKVVSKPIVSDQQPPNTTILITNLDMDDECRVLISLPSSGNLWVAYEFGDEPARDVSIWHQGGMTEEVPLGFNIFQVNETDAIVYQLASPTNSIKLGWAYV